jgi:hypothetical protein
MDAGKVARNEATFREANEQIALAAERIGVDRVPFVCECADVGCTAVVRLTLDQYERVRADPRTFLNIPGHQELSRPHVRVLADHGDYLLVEKIGEAGEIAESLDERTNGG